MLVWVTAQLLAAFACRSFSFGTAPSASDSQACSPGSPRIEHPAVSLRILLHICHPGLKEPEGHNLREWADGFAITSTTGAPERSGNSFLQRSYVVYELQDVCHSPHIVWVLFHYKSVVSLSSFQCLHMMILLGTAPTNAACEEHKPPWQEALPWQLHSAQHSGARLWRD